MEDEVDEVGTTLAAEEEDGGGGLLAALSPVDSPTTSEWDFLERDFDDDEEEDLAEDLDLPERRLLDEEPPDFSDRRFWVEEGGLSEVAVFLVLRTTTCAAGEGEEATTGFARGSS